MSWNGDIGSPGTEGEPGATPYEWKYWYWTVRLMLRRIIIKARKMWRRS